MKPGPKPSLASNTQMFFLRVSLALKEKLSILSPDESRQVLEKAADKKNMRHNDNCA